MFGEYGQHSSRLDPKLSNFFQFCFPFPSCRLGILMYLFSNIITLKRMILTLMILCRVLGLSPVQDMVFITRYVDAFFSFGSMLSVLSKLLYVSPIAMENSPNSM